MDDVLYRIVDGIGSIETVTQSQMAAAIKAIESIKIPASTQLLLWRRVEARATQHSFKSFCVSRVKALAAGLFSSSSTQRTCYSFIEQVLKNLQELSTDSGGLLGELVNFALMLKLKLKEPVS